MSRTYELALVVEPRKTEDEVQAIANQYKELVEAAGGSIEEIDHWGKRKLAYPIEKYTEGSYAFLYLTSEEGIAWSGIERRALQDESILRHLVVRTDLDLKRAERAKVQPKRIRPGDEREERAGRRDRDDRGRDRDDRGRDRDDRGRDRDDRGRDREDRGRDRS